MVRGVDEAYFPYIKIMRISASPARDPVMHARGGRADDAECSRY
jgi:hypothetical protein